MARINNIEFHEAAWDQMLSGIVDAWAVPRAEGIADKANAHVAAQAEAVLAQPDSVEPEGNTKADKVVADARSRRRRANKKAARGRLIFGFPPRLEWWARQGSNL